VLVPVADGTEEIEAVTIIDTLTRAGADVRVASVVGKREIRCAQGVQITADCLMKDCANQSWDLIALPGGKGAQHVSDCKEFVDTLKKHHSEKKLIGAICSAPALILAKHGLLPGKATCHSGEQYVKALGSKYDGSKDVVESENIVTSQGPGTALEFSLHLVAKLVGRDKEMELKKKMECHW
jgi:4-methyl-5(b-hydroxyethyl)-thiazole monophosphate biosynthesis